MTDLTFYIVDVFAEEKFAGNQLAVFRGGGGLSGDIMLRIAQEMHYSETTFILSETPTQGGYDVRIFTPGGEVPFAGHPTLGTAHILRQEVLKQPVELVRLNLKAGQIPVTFEPSTDETTVSWMQQIQPVFGETLEAGDLAAALSLDTAEIDTRFPIQQVSTGLEFIIVPLKTLASLKKAHTNRDKYFALIEHTWAKQIMMFCPEPHLPENNISVRMFADNLGIPEDPATGSGQGCLAAYLVKQRYFGEAKIDLRSEQGFEVGRPSLLYLRASEQDGQFDIRVGGRSITIAKGEFV
jgi:trans-2,3-dihydro-3-hydroxyanthranilate isomerase